MSPHELLVHAACHLPQVTSASLLEQEREEVDLEEKVAELVEQLRVVAGERRVRNLVRLLDGVRHDRRSRLLAIPRAVAAQTLRQPLQVEESFGGSLAGTQRELPAFGGRGHLNRSSSAS
jgi:hypothetical protein